MDTPNFQAVALRAQRSHAALLADPNTKLEVRLVAAIRINLQVAILELDYYRDRDTVRAMAAAKRSAQLRNSLMEYAL